MPGSTGTLPAVSTPIRSLTAVMILLAACGGEAAPSTSTTTSAPPSTTTSTSTTSTSTTTTTVPATTTTTSNVVTLPPEGYRSPVNGLSPPLETLLDRRAISFKIDNHPEARPQSGLQEADAVIELLVEGGFTRFIAVFHDDDSEYLGPVRSLRPTDSTLMPAIPSVLVMSGGQPWVQSLTASRKVRLLGESTSGLFRTSSRTAPHNLYADTAKVRAAADARAISNDPPQWLYRVDEWEIPDATATEVILHWSQNSVITWRYEGGRYTRWMGSTPHEYRTEKGEKGQITVDVLVILAGRQYTAEPPGGDGTPVPATDTVGTGTAWVISRGAVWTGTWERGAITEQFRLLGPDGEEAVVPAGVPWVSIFPGGNQIEISGP